jgi:hypothetical protein
MSAVSADIGHLLRIEQFNYLDQLWFTEFPPSS